MSGIVGVYKIHAHNCLLTTKVQYKTLSFTGLLVFSQPVIRRVPCIFRPAIVIVLSKEVACQKHLAKLPFALLGSPRAIIAVAADYLLRVTRLTCGLREIKRQTKAEWGGPFEWEEYLNGRPLGDKLNLGRSPSLLLAPCISSAPSLLLLASLLSFIPS